MPIMLEEYFKSLLNKKVPENLYNPIDYILQQGGKRLRPNLVRMSAKMFGADENAVKFIQNGQLFIKRNGVVYSATGAVVK